MPVSGVLGRGSYRSVIAGTHHANGSSPSLTYHSCANELVSLNEAHREVVRLFYIRDRIFDNKTLKYQFVNGLYKFHPERRAAFHMNDVMQAIRRRSFWMQRIQQQRAINEKVAAEALARGAPHPSEALRTKDAAAYFSPRSLSAAVNWPNFWQHPSNAHLVPKVRWERHPELKGITRVVHRAAPQANDY